MGTPPPVSGWPPWTGTTRPLGGGTKGPGGNSGEPPHPFPQPPLSPPPARERRRETAAERQRPRTLSEGLLQAGGRRRSRGECSCASSASCRPHAHSRITCSRLAALCRRHGPQQHGGARRYADEARLDARLGKAGGQAKARKPPPRPPALTHRRPTGPRTAPTTAWRPVYTQGGRPGEGGGQGWGPRAARQSGGGGNSGAAPHTPPWPAGHEGADPLPPPAAKGASPLPQKEP